MAATNTVFIDWSTTTPVAADSTRLGEIQIAEVDGECTLTCEQCGKLFGHALSEQAFCGAAGHLCDVYSVPEVAREFVEYFNNQQPERIAEALKKLGLHPLSDLIDEDDGPIKLTPKKQPRFSPRKLCGAGTNNCHRRDQYSTEPEFICGECEAWCCSLSHLDHHIKLKHGAALVYEMGEARPVEIPEDEDSDYESGCPECGGDECYECDGCGNQSCDCLCCQDCGYYECQCSLCPSCEERAVECGCNVCKACGYPPYNCEYTGCGKWSDEDEESTDDDSDDDATDEEPDEADNGEFAVHLVKT